jgi:hypothetical protein
VFKRVIIASLLIAVVAGVSVFIRYWVHTQPVWIVDEQVDDDLLATLPETNKNIIEFIEQKGRLIAPNYENVVCTEFVTEVIDQFASLTIEEKRAISIITNEDLQFLIKNESPVIKGVQTALTTNNKGITIDNPEEVRPGDFVQFWNEHGGKPRGHCGIVLSIEPNETLTLFSSHSLTNGYGKQKYLWPDKVFFVRLK